MQIAYCVESDKKTDGFIAYCPVMKPTSIYAKTREEVASKISDVMKLYLQKHPEIKEIMQTIKI